MKDEELYGLLKIPDEVIIRRLRIELGKQSSYIEELEDEIERLRLLSMGTTEEIRKLRKDALFDEYRANIKNLVIKIARLKKDKESLIVRLTMK